MANVSPIVTALPEYVEQNKSELIAKTVLGANTISKVNVTTGVKGATTLNLLNTDIAFGDGNSCGFEANSEQTISQRTLTPAALKVNVEYCDKKLRGSYAQHLVMTGAGKETLPFEEKFIGDVVAKTQNALEKLIWQGDAENDNEFDGFIKVIEDAGIDEVALSGVSAYVAIKEVASQMPAEVIGGKPRIYVSDSLYASYMQDLVAANLYHYNPNDGANEYKLPGTQIVVTAVHGLNGADKEYIIGADEMNMVYGTDMIDDSEVYDFWYSKDDRTFKLDIEFIAGTQVAFPDQIVFASIAKA